VITIEDLQKELSAIELLQLSDLNNTGAIGEDTIADAIADAQAFIGSFIIIPTNPTAYLISLAVDLSIYNLRKLHDLQDPALLKVYEERLIKMARGVIPITTLQEASNRTTAMVSRHGNTKLNFRGWN
jgi:phage gp36-like protein